MTPDILRKLDLERCAAGRLSGRGDIVKEYSPDGSRCLIVYSCCSVADIDEVIRDEMSQADAGGYCLEWKVYAHDLPPNLKERLSAAGFEQGHVESVMVLPITERRLAVFDAPPYEIRRIRLEGLSDIAVIAREIGRTDVEEEQQRLAALLRETPDQVSIFAAYIEGEAAACGRVHFTKGGEFAELCGGRTVPAYRNRGLYTALVRTRLREALARNRKYALVDALPSSASILMKRGFERVTCSQPFTHQPRVAERPRCAAT
jgi:N-acetylglutamate synthase-like GNAT family acetyltransferase